MKVLLLALLSLIVLSDPGRCQDIIFIDWIDHSNPAYQLLLDACRQAGTNNWVSQRLERGEAVPQASARELVEDLVHNPGVLTAFKQQLIQAFPSEVQAQGQFQSVSHSANELSGQLDSIDQRIQAIQATLAKNNYSRHSTPDNTITLSASYNLSEWGQFFTIHNSTLANQLASEFNGKLEGASYNFRLEAREDNYNPTTNGINSGYGAPAVAYQLIGSSASLLLDPEAFPNIQVGLGGGIYGFNLNFSNLIYSADSFPYKSPFFQGTTIPSPIRTDGVSASHTVQGLYLRKQGQKDWWIFTDSQLVVEPSALSSAFYDPYEHRHMNEIAGRFDLRDLNLIPGTEDSLPYFTFVLSNNDQAQLAGFNLDSFYQPTTGIPFPAPESNRAFSAGLSSQVSGGGNLVTEFAYSDWRRQDSVWGSPNFDKSFQDEALYANFSKTFGHFTLGVELSQVGPYFISGGERGQQYENYQSGSLYDSTMADPRPGTNGRITWEMISSEPAWITNNSQRAFVQTSWLGIWGSLGLSGGVSKEINPSGPWVRSMHFFGNNPNNGADWYNLFGANYYTQPPGTSVAPSGYNPYVLQYNLPTSGQAYYNGQLLKDSVYYPNGVVNWDDLEQLGWDTVYETIMLSQKGVGDNNLRADSIKYLNSWRASLYLDFASIFGSALARNLQLFSELRDTDESFHVANFNNPDLLVQSVSGADFLWDFDPVFEVVATAGYETWNSQASFYPIFFVDRSWGVGMNIQLAKLLQGLVLNLRYRVMDHQDLNFGQRSFTGWTAILGTSYTMWN